MEITDQNLQICVINPTRDSSVDEVRALSIQLLPRGPSAGNHPLNS
jgi:hypothetical protein